MKELSIVYAVSEFVPLMKKLLKGKNFNKNAVKILEILRDVTNQNSASDIVQTLNSDSQKMMRFQNEIFDMILYAESNVNDVRCDDCTREERIQNLSMIVILALALCGCLYFMVSMSDKLSGECVTIISTVVGVFGACMKDAFTALCALKNNVKNNKIESN